MPQLDKVTFLSQFFWLCFFYLGFYFFIYKFFLPKMSRILKFRKKKMNLSHQGVTTTQQENEKVGESYETLVAEGLNTSRTLFGSTSQKSIDWVKKTSSQLNQTHLQEMNNTYIFTLGESSASEALALQQSSSRISKKTFFSLFLAKMQFFSTVMPSSGSKLSTQFDTNLSRASGEYKKKGNLVEKNPGFTESTNGFNIEKVNQSQASIDLTSKKEPSTQKKNKKG